MSIRLTGLAMAASLGLVGAAHAGTILISGPGVSGAALTATSAAGATTSPFMLGNFGDAGVPGLVSTNTVQIANGGSISFSPDGSVPQAGVWYGTVANQSASPFTGGSNPSKLPEVNYLAAQPNDAVTINLGTNPAPLSLGIFHTFSLLWGTVDNYNSLNLDFRNDGMSLFDLTVTGTEVAQAAGNGFQPDGSTGAFVSLVDLPGFNQVVATSTASAFEFDPSVQVPEPASLAVLGFGLAGLAFARRRQA